MSQHILIVDDDVELCELLKQYLESESFTVSLVHDGMQAVEQLHGQHNRGQLGYDAIVLDSMCRSLVKK